MFLLKIRFIVHTEFDFTASTGQNYYASAGIIPKKTNHLSYLILFPLQKQKNQIWHLRLIILFTDLTAISFLFLFSWNFTRRMIVPIEKSRQKQTHFIAAASHELRAPLTIIHTTLEVLKKEPEQKEHFINLITEESNRMQTLINDMLLLANADSNHLPMRMELCHPDDHAFLSPIPDVVFPNKIKS